jgi:LPS sulfotransferase NodH
MIRHRNKDMIRRLVLLTHHRSGSTLLTMALQEHPNILMHGEILSPEPDLNGPEFMAFEADGDDYLRHRIFGRAYPDDVEVVGLKVHYTHARQSRRARRAWSYLVSERDIAVVHLWRENMLQAYVSLQIASRTDEWVRRVGASPSNTEILRFEVDPNECENYFSMLTVYRQWVQRAFRSHATMELEYDRDLRDDASYARTLERIAQFVDLSPVEIAKPLEKQARYSPAEHILNIDALREHFQHTLYSSFFET